MNSIPFCTPEEAGIPSQAVCSMIQDLREQQVPIHSLLLGRHGKLVFEGYYAPFKKEDLHRMFSVSKSLVSLAIGLLEEEGKLSLDDSIIQYFPEYVPENPHPWLAAMTIRDMLKMQTCHSSTTYKRHPDKDWVESFFITPPSHPSGRIFLYDTSASHTLCALVAKRSGRELLDYLKDRVLREIGFSEDSYFLKDPFGIPLGGSGLMARPQDLMRLAFLLLNGGVSSSGRQLLPAAYLKEALSCQTPTISGPTPEESLGYGYQFWRISHNGYAAYGMGGQLMICLPDQDLVCVTTADTQEFKGSNQLIYNSLYHRILPSLQPAPLPENLKEAGRLADLKAELSLFAVPGSKCSSKEEAAASRIWNVQQEGAPFSRFSFEMDPENQRGVFRFQMGDSWESLPFGLGHVEEGRFPGYKERCASSGAWTSDETLFLKVQLIGESVGSVNFNFSFGADQVCLQMKKTEETLYNEYQGFLTAI